MAAMNKKTMVSKSDQRVWLDAKYDQSVWYRQTVKTMSRKLRFTSGVRQMNAAEVRDDGYMTNDYMTSDYMTSDYMTSDYMTSDCVTSDCMTSDYMTSDHEMVYPSEFETTASDSGVLDMDPYDYEFVRKRNNFNRKRPDSPAKLQSWNQSMHKRNHEVNKFCAAFKLAN